MQRDGMERSMSIGLMDGSFRRFIEPEKLVGEKRVAFDGRKELGGSFRASGGRRTICSHGFFDQALSSASFCIFRKKSITPVNTTSRIPPPGPSRSTLGKNP